MCEYLITNLSSKILILWISFSNTKIPGNEAVDAAARLALSTLPARHLQPGYITQAYLRRLMYQRQQQLIDDWWSTACPARYRDLDLQTRRRKPPELGLPRRLLHELIAARTGHGNFAAYHRQFHHEDATLECVCGLETTPTHFIRCRRHATQIRSFRKSMSVDLLTSQLLGHNCVEKFTEFARITGCFGSLPTHTPSAGCEGRGY